MPSLRGCSPWTTAACSCRPIAFRSIARRESETSGHRGIDQVRAGDPAEGPSPRVELVDLDPLAAPYGRLLLTIRTARAVVAGMMVPVLTTVPDAFVSTMLAGYGAFAGVVFAAVAGIPITLLAVALGLLYFKVLRLVWSGSVGALWTCFILGIVVVPWAGLGLYLDTSLQDVVDGRVWFHAVDYAMHHLLLAFLALGTDRPVGQGSRCGRDVLGRPRARICHRAPPVAGAI